jgi:hypothetical protein
MLFHLKSDWESNTKEIEDFLIFPMEFTCPHPINGLGAMAFYSMMGLLKTVIPDRLQCWKKNKSCGCSGGILPLSWVPKSWKTLPPFHRLLKQPQWTNGLEDTEFWASAKLLKTELGSTEETKFWSLGKTETPEHPNTIPIDDSLSFSMVHFMTPNG